ncbi:hypothetical protein F7734_38075 [Scytonema sp. UIC 10036]|uniref:hypothetical protein n=1 Tax=Scytonema sp. UIC 10036 TaxID=2304196 RepID=UPI0012DA2A4F|nr:hypothetical protein [Scytonema sp. UIC 10036]MUG97808.1 hypothetical protein [Scytonema sp. UIC 10036]
MLSEKEAIGILEENNMKPSTLQRQGQRTLVAKLTNGYSFIIKKDESMPGYLCAYFNSHKNGDLMTWKRIDKNSLLLAIKSVHEFLGIKPQWKVESDRLMTPVTFAFLCLLISTGYLFGSKLAYCNAQNSDIYLSQPEHISVISD